MGLGNTTSAGKTYFPLSAQSWLLVRVRICLSFPLAPSFPEPA